MPKEQCECGEAGYLIVSVTDADGVLLDQVVLCRACRRASQTRRALDDLGLNIGADHAG